MASGSDEMRNPLMGERLAAALRASGEYVEVAGVFYCVDCGRPCGGAHDGHCDEQRQERLQQERLLRMRKLGGSMWTGVSHGRY